MEEVQVHRWDNLVSHLMDQFKEACSPNIKAQVSQKEVLVRQLKLQYHLLTDLNGHKSFFGKKKNFVQQDQKTTLNDLYKSSITALTRLFCTLSHITAREIHLKSCTSICRNLEN